MYIDPIVKEFMPHFDRYELIIQDSTAMKVLKRCDRKYFYRMVLGRTPRTNYNQVVLDAGSIYHKFREVLEILYSQGKDPEECLAGSIKEAMKLTFTPADAKSKWEYVNAVLLMKSFGVAFKYWQKQKTEGAVKVIGTEQAWNVQMPDGSVIGGRKDQLTKWNGLLWIVDFKFTSKDQVLFQKSVEPNDQATRYIYGLTKLHGADVQGVIFEGMHHQKTKDPAIFTIPTQRTRSQLAQWEKEQLHLNKQLKLNRELDVWPMRELHDCQWCEYANVCRKPSEASAAAALSSDFKLSPWNCQNTEQIDIE